MQIIKQLTAPSTVTHALYCAFTGAPDLDLLVVRGSNLLQLYHTVRTQTQVVETPENDEKTSIEKNEDAAAMEDRRLEGEDTFIGSETALEVAREEFSAKLVLVAEWNLQGQITGLAAINTYADIAATKKSGGIEKRSLIVSFKYAKMSIVAWDPFQHNIITQSLHYYERDFFELDFVDPTFQPKLAVDPLSAAATLLYQHDMLVFLPFVRDELLDDPIATAPQLASSATSDFAQLLQQAQKETGSFQSQSGLQQQQQPPLPPISQPSFMIRATEMHESITNIIDITYLYEYREPTIAILYEPIRTWAGRLQLEKDTVSYLVLSVDLQAHTFTSIFSVNNLPYNVRTIIPLRDPIGGSLLVGTNEFIHVDSQGRVNGVFVNPLHSISSELELKDQSSLSLFLEGCQAHQLDGGADDQVVVVLESGELLTLRFHIESRKVYELTVSKLPKDIRIPNPTLIASLKTRYLFVGSATADSRLIQWKRQGEITADDDTKTAVLTSQPAPKETATESTHDDIDDIYGNLADQPVKQTSSAINSGFSDLPIVIRVTDKLSNYGPINDMVACRAPEEYDAGDETSLDIVAATGTGADKSLTVFTRKLRPQVASTLKLKNSFKRIWTLRPASLSSDSYTADEEGLFDTYLVGSNDKSTFIFQIGQEFVDITSKVSKLRSCGPTLACSTVFNGRIVVFVCEAGIVLYDSELTYITRKRLKSPPANIVFADEYIVVNFDENTQAIYHVKKKKKVISVEVSKIKEESLPAADTTPATPAELDGTPNPETEELESTPIATPATTSVITWDITERAPSSKLPPPSGLFAGTSSVFSSALIGDSKRVKRKLDEKEVEHPQKEPSVPILYSVGKEGTLYAVYLTDSSVRFDMSALMHLPNVLRLKDRTFVDDSIAQAPQATSSQIPTVKIHQISHFTIKNGIEEGEYLALLTSDSFHLIIYQFLQTPNGEIVLIKSRDSLGIPTLSNAKTNFLPKIIPFTNISGYAGIFVVGPVPLIIFKPPQSPIMYHKLAVPDNSPAIGFTQFNTAAVYSGLAYIDNSFVLRIATLPNDVDFGCAWPARRINLSAPVLSIAYHETSNILAVALLTSHEFEALDPEGNPIPDLNLKMPRPTAYQSSLKLLSPESWKVIDSVEYQTNESIMTLKSVMLEVSEKTHQKKEFIVAGTSVIRGEDLAAQGGFYIYEIIEVVPEPGRPETSHKLKQISFEVSKGAVTSICEVSGNLLIAQAQKVVVRNIQEDNSVVPVAFMDMNTYVSSCKSIKYMVLLSDAIRSVWLVGFGKEPYRMTLFGKDYQNVEVTSCDFIVFDKTLHILVADTQQRLHVLQYDPEDPSPFSGQKLLRRSEMFLGRDIDTMLLLPYTSSQTPLPGFIPLCGARDGSLLTIVPVTEATYRALYVIQQQISDREEHTLGLNPRMHHAMGVSAGGPVSGQGQAQSRQLLDYNLVRRFIDLPVERRSQYVRRLGKTGYDDVWKALRVVDEVLEYL